MNRKALIIYCTETESGKLIGPQKDNYNIREYLKSNLGGQWYDKEIISLENPKVNEIKNCIYEEFHNVDYSFIVFSGHGCIEETRKQDYLEVVDGDIPLSALICTAPRQTLIIDACRSYFRRVSDSMQKSFSYLNEYYTGQSNTRLIFDRAVCQAEEGFTILYSSSANQSSLDTNKGGAYIYSLLSICKEWEEDGNGIILDLKNAHKYACVYLKKNFQTIQRPEIIMEKRRHYFPIAVRYDLWTNNA